MSFQITADSIPQRDTWGWEPYWSCEEYMQWHKLNVQQYGADVANQKFVSAWSELDTFDHNYNWCKYNREFTAYFKSYGIDVGNILSDIVTAGGNVVDSVTNVTQAASNTTQMLRWIIPVAVIAALIIAGMWAYKNFAK